MYRYSEDGKDWLGESDNGITRIEKAANISEYPRPQSPGDGGRRKKHGRWKLTVMVDD